jgi:regulator of protease activity HflC (stomatin/prohibitin superfamily)
LLSNEEFDKELTISKHEGRIKMVISTVIVIVSIFFLLVLMSNFYKVREEEVIIIERSGKYNRTLTAGIHAILPGIERPRSFRWVYKSNGDISKVGFIYRVDLRETILRFPIQQIFTRDNIATQARVNLYCQVIDPYAFVYKMTHLPDAIENMVNVHLRTLVGSLELSKALTQFDYINSSMNNLLDNRFNQWGLKISRFELKELLPPDEIVKILERQVRAECLKQAVIIEAEGASQAEILIGQGGAASKRAHAQVEADSWLEWAKADKRILELYKEVIPAKDPSQYLLALRYIRMLPQMMQGKNDKMIIFPYELTSVMGENSMLNALTQLHNTVKPTIEEAAVARNLLEEKSEKAPEVKELAEQALKKAVKEGAQAVKSTQHSI